MKRRLALWAGVVALVVFLSASAMGMFYRPAKVAKIWDTWLFYHEGVHYLYALHNSTAESPWDGISLATSKDGVHFTEVGPILSKREDAKWMGTGSVWPAGDKFVLNFSEFHNDIQAIFLATSDDLIHWQRLGDEYRSDPDARWYDDGKYPPGRWDCIWALAREEGGYWGYITAFPWRRSAEHPDALPYRSVGMMESPDGLCWRAVAPPTIEWGTVVPPGDDRNAEVGAIAKVKGRYYLQIGSNGHAGDAVGMYILRSKDPKGPFSPDVEAYRLLGTKGHTHTYFSRFYQTPDGLLVNHHSISRGGTVWLAPLKRAVVDKEGHMRLYYWQGNELVKDEKVQIDLGGAGKVCRYRGGAEGSWRAEGTFLQAREEGGALVLLGNEFDLANGIVLEGRIQMKPVASGKGGVGLYIEQDAQQGTAIVLGTNGRTEIGLLKHGEEMGFWPDDSLDVGVKGGKEYRFRLLLRQFLLEFYLDDRLVQCYSMPEKVTGRIGLVVEGGEATFKDLAGWSMNLHGDQFGIGGVGKQR